MGIFTMASSGLSLYIWLVSVWDVSRPLSSSIHLGEGSSKSLDLFSAIATAFGQPAATPRRGPKRSQARLESMHREQARSSLKAVVIWLVVKGLEPLFDNSLGYVVPLYSLWKTLVLLIFLRFRTQLSTHLFDSFILPLGKPNAPLLDLGSMNLVVLPTARFLLSLPFAHLLVSLKNQVGPFLQGWTNELVPATKEEVTMPEAAAISGRPVDIVRPPVHGGRLSSNTATIRSTTTSSVRRSSGGGRKSGGGGDDGSNGAYNAPLNVRKQASTEFLSHSRRGTHPTSGVTDSIMATLQTLPAPPEVLHKQKLQDLPDAPRHSPQAISALQQFAFIPPATPPTQSPSQAAAGQTSQLSPSTIMTPRMPGFLGGQRLINGQAGDKEGSAGPSVSAKSSKRVASDFQALTKSRDSEQNYTQSLRVSQSSGNLQNKSLTASGIRRKRVEETTDLAPRKTRATPSREGSKTRAIQAPTARNSKDEGAEVTFSPAIESNEAPSESTRNRSKTSKAPVRGGATIRTRRKAA